MVESWGLRTYSFLEVFYAKQLIMAEEEDTILETPGMSTQIVCYEAQNSSKAKVAVEEIEQDMVDNSCWKREQAEARDWGC